MNRLTYAPEAAAHEVAPFARMIAARDAWKRAKGLARTIALAGYHHAQRLAVADGVSRDRVYEWATGAQYHDDDYRRCGCVSCIKAQRQQVLAVLKTEAIA